MGLAGEPASPDIISDWHIFCQKSSFTFASTHSSTFNPCSFPSYLWKLNSTRPSHCYLRPSMSFVAPVEILVEALNSHLNLQLYKVLYVCGNYSRILSRLDRNFTSWKCAEAFTSFQLMTVLEENHHSFLIVEHDPMLYEDANSVSSAGEDPARASKAEWSPP